MTTRISVVGVGSAGCRPTSPKGAPVDAKGEMAALVKGLITEGRSLNGLPKNSWVLAELLAHSNRGNPVKIKQAIVVQLEGGIVLPPVAEFSLDGITDRQFAFQSAIASDDIELVRYFLQAGLDPNFEIDGKPMVVHAAYHAKNVDIIHLVQAHSRGEADPILPITLRAREYVTPELLEAFPLSETDYQKLHTKAIAHFYNITGDMPDGSESLEGSFTNFMTPYLSSALHGFQQSNFLKNCRIGSGFQKLLAAFREIHRPGRTDQEVVEKIQSGELCFVNSGWRGHAITLCFFGGYMAICNRGEGSSERGTLKVFKIDQKKFKKKLLDKIRQAKGQHPWPGKSFLYFGLPRFLSGTQDDLCREFAAVAPKQQKTGVCALAAPKAAIRFAWIMLLREQGVDHHLEVGRNESKRFTDFAAQFVLENYGESTVEGFREMEGVASAFRAKNEQIQKRQTAHATGNKIANLARAFVERAHSFKAACLRGMDRVVHLEVAAQ